jgi:hypothetical protein
MTALLEMLPVILQKSRSRKLEWEQLGGNEYIARLGGVALTASDQRGDKFVSVVGDDGMTLESVSFQKTTKPHDEMIAEIYELARREALKIDDSLEALKKALDKL